MSDQEKEKRKGFSWGGSILMLFIFYLLAPGPLIWLYTNGFMFESVRDFFLAFYLPLALLAEYNEFAGKILRWYIRLWGG